MDFNAVGTLLKPHSSPPFECGHTGSNFIWLIIQSENYCPIRMVTLQVSMYYFWSQKWMHCINFCSSIIMIIVCCSYGRNSKWLPISAIPQDWQDTLMNFFQNWRTGTSFFFSPGYFHTNPETFDCILEKNFSKAGKAITLYKLYYSSGKVTCNTKVLFLLWFL